MKIAEIVRRRCRGAGLRQFAALRFCSGAELDILERHSVVMTLEAGQVLCRQGAVGRQAFLVLEGDAGAAVDGTEVNRIGSGEFVGEMALLSHTPRTATVSALTPLTVLVFSIPEFEKVLRSVPPLARRMSVALSDRLRAGQLASITA